MKKEVDGLTPADGGPAFPIVATGESGQGYIEAQGVTILDYFAAKAMAALIAQGELNRVDYPQNISLGKEAYWLAKGMLRARSEVQP